MNQDNSQTKRLFTGLVVGAIFGLGVGLLVGLAFAYLIAPIQWTDGSPQDLREDYAAYYWELVSESYARHGNLELAKKQLGDWSDKEKLQAALTRARIESSPDLKMVLDSLETKVVGEAGTPAATAAPATTPTAGAKTGESLLPVLGVILLLVFVFVVIALLVVRSRKRKPSQEAPTMVDETPEWLATMRPEESAASAPALGHFVTSYALGNDNYDESYSIETPTGEFLGECGVGISETIGVGDPDKVTAFELWLFDKNDIRTITKVLMSEHAYHDQEMRASLASKGEAVLAQGNIPIVLETATLSVEATVTELIYGNGALPPNSFIDRLTIELVTRQKAGQPEPPSSAGEETQIEF